MRAVAPKSLPAWAGYADIGCSVKYMRCMLVSPIRIGPRAARPASRAGGEFADELHEGVRLFHVHAVAGFLDHGEAASRDGPRVRLAAFEGHDLVRAPPHHERAGAHTAEEMRERRVVHVGLPGDPEGHLAVEVPLLELRRRGIGAVQPIEDALILEPRPRGRPVGRPAATWSPSPRRSSLRSPGRPDSPGRARERPRAPGRSRPRRAPTAATPAAPLRRSQDATAGTR